MVNREEDKDKNGSAQDRQNKERERQIRGERRKENDIDRNNYRREKVKGTDQREEE